MDLEIGQRFSPYKMFQGIFIPTNILKADIHSTAKLLYGFLSKCAGKKGYCWPSQEVIAKETNLAPRNVQRNLKILEQKGFIERKLSKQENKKTTRYFFLYHPSFLHDGFCTSNPSVLSGKKSNKKSNSYVSFSKEKEEKETLTGDCTDLILRDVKDEKEEIAPEKTKSEEIRGKKETLHRKHKRHPVKITAAVQPYIDVWEDLGLTKHERDTKTMHDAVKALKKLIAGKFFHDKKPFKSFEGFKLSLSQWETALERLVKAQSDEYYPANKSWLKVSLINFIYNPFVIGEKVQCLLLHFLQNEPQERMPNHYPDITKALIKIFGETFFGDLNFQPANGDKVKFNKGGNRTGVFFEKNKKRIAPHFNLTPYKKAQLVIRAIQKDVEDNYFVVSPGFVCSNTTFDIRLPTYLKKQAIFSSIDRSRFNR